MQTQPPVPGEADPAARLLAARLVECLGGLDLTSADGRAGIRTLLAEIDRLSPDAILRQAASIELRRVGWGKGRGEAAGDLRLANEAPAVRLAGPAHGCAVAGHDRRGS